MTVRYYRAYNGPAPTTASQAAVTTGTAIKTMLQLAPPAGVDLTVKSWGFSMDGAAAGAGVEWELFTTTVAATGTAHAAAGIVKVNIPSGPASALVAGVATTTTMYTATTEGTVANARMLDAPFIQPTGAYVYTWPLGEEPVVEPSTFLRVRVKAAVAVNAICWVCWGE